MPAILAASHESKDSSVTQLRSQLQLQLSKHASAAQHQILVSRPSQPRRKRALTASSLQNQHLRARSSTTRDERNRSCDCWTKHMHDAWQQRKQQQQQQEQQQESRQPLTLDSHWHLFRRSVSRATAHAAQHREGQWHWCARPLTHSCGECSRSVARRYASAARSLLRRRHQSNRSSRTCLSVHSPRSDIRIRCLWLPAAAFHRSARKGQPAASSP